MSDSTVHLMRRCGRGERMGVTDEEWAIDNGYDADAVREALNEMEIGGQLVE
jgi:hypothetical protein